MDHVSLICIFSSLPSTRPFWSSLASDSIGTPKLSEFVREQSHDGWPTGKFYWRKFPETKLWGRGWGPKRTISCYGGVELGMWWGPGRGCDNVPINTKAVATGKSPSNLTHKFPYANLFNTLKFLFSFFRWHIFSLDKQHCECNWRHLQFG